MQRFREAGIIWPVRSNTQLAIRYPHCTRIVREDPASAATLAIAIDPAGTPGDLRAAEDARIAMVNEFCQSDQGQRVRTELDLFNAGQLLLAARDNRANVRNSGNTMDVQCSDGRMVRTLFPPANCLRSDWSVRLPGIGAALAELPDSAIPMRNYVFMADPAATLMSDWVVSSPATASGIPPLHELATDAQLGTGPFMAQVIAEIETIIVDGHEFVHTGDVTEDVLLNDAGQELRVRVDRLCSLRSGIQTLCEGLSASTRARNRTPVAYRVTIRGPAGAEFSLALEARPSALPVDMMIQAGVLQRSTGKRLIGSGQIRLACTSDAPSGVSLPAEGEAETGCDIIWLRPQAPNPENEGTRRSAPFQLAIDGLIILDEDGNLTAEGFRLGYGDLLGFGVDDPGSFASLLSRQELPDDFTLTVRPEMQRLIQQSVVSGERVPCLANEDCGDLRVDLIVMDADGEDAGELLGFASLPRSGIGLSRWDLIALDTAAPARSPFAAGAWRAHDGTATPGSTFKIVTSLAGALQALATSDRQLEELLLGNISEGSTALMLGLAASPNLEAATAGRETCRHDGPVGQNNRSDVLPVPTSNGADTARCIANAGDASYISIAQGRCETLGRNSSGVCEAMTRSSNLYFGGLALYMDSSSLLLPGSQVEHRETADSLAMVQMAARLFGRDIDTGAALSVFDALSPHYSAVARLRPSPLTLAVRDVPADLNPRRLDLALSGIGQAVSATPLAMASISASVAEGRVIEPRIVPLELRIRLGAATPAVVPLLPGQGGGGFADEILNHLREGMANAVREGTAIAAQGGLNEGLAHFKTGTAQIVIDRERTQAAWTVGYVEAPGGNSNITQRISIACRVAPTNQDSGLCARIVGDLVSDLNAGMP
ncbi:penicillin-binding transpeptidase domain-containing protein [Gymnodinialimonas sp.]